MPGVRAFAVETGEAGQRLDRWFLRRFPQLAHGRLQKLLRTGQVRVDGARAKAGQRLEAGQVVRVPPLPEGEPRARPAPERGASAREAAALVSRVLVRTPDVIVLDKPAGMAVQGGTGAGRHLDSLLDALRFDSAERPRLVHRLDRDTSGVLALARNAAAARALGHAFRGEGAIKVYWALVVGVPKPRAGEIALALTKHGPPGRERMAADDMAGKRALTRYAVVEALGGKVSWAALMPLTGRTHQLRAHLAAIGTPILGDGKYGGARAFLAELPQARALHLHARALILDLPGLDLPGAPSIRATAKLPPHMAETWHTYGLDPEDDGDPFDLGRVHS